MSKHYYALFFTLIILNTNQVNAQEVHGEPDVWFLLLNHYKLNDNWSLGNEFHMRFDDYLNDKEQLLIRPFLNYHANPNVVFTVGYTFINTYPYGQYPLPASKPENNIWEQVTLIQNVGKINIQHRYRWEHRWQGDLVQNAPGDPFIVDGFSYSNRFRYRITVRRPISERLFINVFDELWIRMDEHLRNVDFDRNWLYLALGLKLNDKVSLQAAYLHHYAKNNPTRFEKHPTLQFTVDARLR
ncbi:MAG: DUF2490 domain-containing protein [Bacteroidota bacterium]